MEHGLACSFRVAPGARLADEIERAARVAEEAGLVSWWASGEREVVNDRSLDSTLGLQCVARATTSLRLGFSGELPSVHPAAVRAKQIASLDWFSGGRVELGLDLADPPGELIDPEHGDEHLSRALDRHAAMRALWTQSRPAHLGDHVKFRGVIALPKPVGDRVPTTHVRSTSEEALERLVATSGAPAGWIAWRETPEQLAAGLAVLDTVLGDAAATVRRTWFVDVADLPASGESLSGLAGRVDELVAVFDRVPTDADLAGLSFPA